ncbi:hypothetical protein HYX11_03205 [Candidatus Woesearchaeota archaeon]|nr:hypothetical protein [Candidatus Woesearchaeota archaeon]
MALLPTLIFFLGLSNLLFLILVLLSCRCMLGTFVRKLWQYQWYQKFYSKHCYYWWGFTLSVFLHATLALYFYGIPF